MELVEGLTLAKREKLSQVSQVLVLRLFSPRIPALSPWDPWERGGAKQWLRVNHTHHGNYEKQY
jgi:hypothetical protein